MTSIITRRSLLGGLLSAMAAPAIVRASSLMPVKVTRIGEPALIVYGRSPGMMALPDLSTIEAMTEMLRRANEEFEKMIWADLLATGQAIAVRCPSGAFRRVSHIFKDERDCV